MNASRMRCRSARLGRRTVLQPEGRAGDAARLELLLDDAVGSGLRELTDDLQIRRDCVLRQTRAQKLDELPGVDRLARDRHDRDHDVLLAEGGWDADRR